MTKEERAAKAYKHWEECSDAFRTEIKEALQDTVEYRGDYFLCDTDPVHTEFRVQKGDSIKIAAGYPNPAVLNFASYKKPGGGFLSGSNAQEEQLCHQTTLYNILHAMPAYYERNLKNLNNSLYTDAALFTPGIVITSTRDECSVITCAAPNAGSYYKYAGNGQKQRATVYEILKHRIEFIRYICEVNNVRILITGAWGCGVFKNELKDVVTLFKDVFKNSKVPVVVFAGYDEATYTTIHKILYS